MAGQRQRARTGPPRLCGDCPWLSGVGQEQPSRAHSRYIQAPVQFKGKRSTGIRNPRVHLEPFPTVSSPRQKPSNIGKY
jgi:hypothetical protein